MTELDENYRLSTDIYPMSYDIHLERNFGAKDTFVGKAIICFDVLVKRKTIALHQKNLHIRVARLMPYNSKNAIVNLSIGKPTKYDIFEISTESDLEGQYELTIIYVGSLTNECGFYWNQYRLYDDSSNKMCNSDDKACKFMHKFRDLAKTKFKPMYARQVFPCFDEPRFKASFVIRLFVPTSDDYNAACNSPISNKEIDKTVTGYSTIAFREFQASTYEIFFIIHDFKCTSKKAHDQASTNSDSDIISVFTTRDQPQEKIKFAVDIIDKAFNYYKNAFVSNNTPVFHMFVIPEIPRHAKSPELPFFKNTELLYDEHNNSIIDKRKIVITICHKMAYRYVRQLVSLQWWNDVWFIEGLVTYFSYKCANEILPNEGYMEQFFVDIMQNALVIDAKLNSHPLIYNVEKPYEISSYFDEISSKKGASLMCMLEGFFGQENFKNYITNIFIKLTCADYKDINDNMLNNMLDNKKSKVNVNAAINTWVWQKGYPVINVKRSGNMFVLTQKRFLADSDTKCDTSKSEYGYRWTVPITYITSSNEIPTLVWFDKNAKEVLISVDHQTRWVKFNVGQVGYYRVNYGKEWKTFIDLLLCNPTRLSVSDRANLLDDLFNLAEADEVDYTVLLDLMLYLYQECRATPWAVVCPRLKKMYLMLNEAKERSAWSIKRYIAALIKIIYEDLDWTVDDAAQENLPETHVDQKLRAMILELACLTEVSGAREKVSNLLANFFTSNTKPHPDIREVVYRYGVLLNFNADDWSHLVQLYMDEVDPVEKYKLLVGITGIPYAELLKKLLVDVIEGDGSSEEDILDCLILMSENPAGVGVVWDYVCTHWTHLASIYKEKYTDYTLDKDFSVLIPAITKYFATERRLDEMISFFKKYPEAGGDADSQAKALKIVSNNIKWVKTKGKKINDWFSENTIGLGMKLNMISDIF